MDSIEEWIMLQKANNLDEGTQKTYKRTLKRVDNFKPLNLITKKDLIEFFATYKTNAGKSLSDATKLLTAIIVKKYFRDNGKPELVDWLKIQKPVDNFDPNNVLLPEDVEMLINEAESHYFKALLAFLWDTGCRVSEAHMVKWKDLQDTTDGFIVNIPTKKVRGGGFQYRKLFLAESSKYLRNLQLSAYAIPENLVFHQTYRQDITLMNRVREKVKDKIKKPITFHKLRHARATYYSKLGMPEDAQRKIFGWTKTSTVPARYKHWTDEDAILQQKRLSGNSGYIQPNQPTPIAQPEPVKLINMANTLFELKEENIDLRKQIEQKDIKWQEQFEFLKNAYEVIRRERMSPDEREIDDINKGIEEDEKNLAILSAERDSAVKPATPQELEEIIKANRKNAELEKKTVRNSSIIK